METDAMKFLTRLCLMLMLLPLTCLPVVAEEIVAEETVAEGETGENTAEQGTHNEVDNPYFSRGHIFFAGGYFQDADANISATIKPLPEVGLDLGDLGVDESDTTWYAEYRWNFAEKWGLTAAAQAYSGRGGIALEKDISFGGEEFPAGISLDTELDINVYFLDLMYHIYHSDRARISIGGGIHAFDFEAKMTGKAFIDDVEAVNSQARSELLAPLPNVRIQGLYAINDRWALMANLGWLSAAYDEYDGKFTYLHLRTHYRLGERFGVAVGYQLTNVDVTRETKQKEINYDVEFSGPSLTFTYAL